MNIFKRLRFLISNIIDIQSRLHKIQESLGRIEGRQLRLESHLGESDFDTKKSEFRVFSQWGEDGIIQALLKYVRIERKIFVEFGVQNYTESNTRFLLINDHWSGLLIDGDKNHVDYIKNDPIYWQHNLKVDCSFITKDNINSILMSNGISGEIGLLSIDIDGNDYWVWEHISVISPTIVVIEYNARFGPERSVTVPYSPDFTREKAHFSGIYYGASLKALCTLGHSKGYSFVGTNAAGNNAFFVKKDLMKLPLKELEVLDGFTKSQFRESRDKKGALQFLSFDDEFNLLYSLDLVDLENLDSRIED